MRYAFPILLVAAMVTTPALADGPTNIPVTLKNHQFTPAEIHIAAGKPAILTVTNQDATAEEFDSSALQIEKVIGGGQYGTIRLRPLAPGKYPFMGEYHSDTAQGVVISE
jgi:hypothetical protein